MIKWVVTLYICLICQLANASKSILLTGFEPFGGSSTNGSWEAIKNLDGKKIGKIKIAVMKLPVVWDEASDQLRTYIIANQPDYIISFGEASHYPPRLETTALNARIQYPDNQHHLPKSKYIYENAPNSLSTLLPVKAIQSKLGVEHIPLMISNDAGGYLCNEVFYTLMYFSDSVSNPSRGFIHLPSLNSAVTNDQGEKIIFDQAKLQHVVELIVKTVTE